MPYQIIKEPISKDELNPIESIVSNIVRIFSREAKSTLTRYNNIKEVYAEDIGGDICIVIKWKVGELSYDKIKKKIRFDGHTGHQGINNKLKKLVNGHSTKAASFFVDKAKGSPIMRDAGPSEPIACVAKSRFLVTSTYKHLVNSDLPDIEDYVLNSENRVYINVLGYTTKLTENNCFKFRLPYFYSYQDDIVSSKFREFLDYYRIDVL